MTDPDSQLPDNRSLLIVDDDHPHRIRLADEMKKRGYLVNTAISVWEAKEVIRQNLPFHAVLELRLGDGSGLDLIPVILKRCPSARIVILTGFGNIATAVAALKAGAVDYLLKPTEVDAVEAALVTREPTLPPPPRNPMSADRVRWEHIHRILEQSDRNVSVTARKLNLHRRTLQRILARPAPPLRSRDDL